jgi:hypothetical protein
MPAKAEMDAIALLKADHRTVEELFSKFESARSASVKQRLVEQICAELTVHDDRRRNLLSGLHGRG